MPLKVCVVGIGYVGLPLAYLLRHYTSADIIAHDIDASRIDAASRGLDHTGMVPNYVVDNFHDSITWTTGMPIAADIYLVCVPTPDKAGIPDYSYVDAAIKSILEVAGKFATIVIESTVGPGTVRDRIWPLVKDDKRQLLVVHSPERINPGPSAYHELHESVKLVGIDLTDHVSLNALLNLYRKAFADVLVVNDTRAAELAKCFENTQRDMNIALMNELSMHCHRNGVDIREVEAALRTKDSSPVFHAGLVGGHCIPVDPYYLAQWYDPTGEGLDLPSISRDIHGEFIRYVFATCLKTHTDPDRPLKVLILGASYKPDIADDRNSGSLELQRMFESRGILCDIYDPALGYPNVFGGNKYNLVIAAVYHKAFYQLTLSVSLPLTIDCKAVNLGQFPPRHFAGLRRVINF